MSFKKTSSSILESCISKTCNQFFDSFFKSSRTHRISSLFWFLFPFGSFFFWLTISTFFSFCFFLSFSGFRFFFCFCFLYWCLFCFFFSFFCLSFFCIFYGLFFLFSSKWYHVDTCEHFILRNGINSSMNNDHK